MNRLSLIALSTTLVVISGGTGLYIGSNGNKPAKQIQTPPFGIPKPSKEATHFTDVVKSIEKYTGKEVSLTGYVYKNQDDFYLVETSQLKTSAIKLDFTTNGTAPDQYASTLPTQTTNSATPQESKDNRKGPFKVTGKIVKDPKNNSPTLVVGSINKVVASTK